MKNQKDDSEKEKKKNFNPKFDVNFKNFFKIVLSSVDNIVLYCINKYQTRPYKRCHDTQPNNTQQNDTLDNDVQHNNNKLRDST